MMLTPFIVVNVVSDDTLNVRAAAGASSDVLGELDPDTEGLIVTGKTVVVDGQRWAPIRHGDLEGWVHTNFIAPQW